MKIFLLLNQAYPFGFALTKRFHLYAKGFVSNGEEAKIIIPLPTEKNDSRNHKTSGIYDEVPFQYTWNKTTRSKNFWFRRFHDVAGALKVGPLILREKPEVLIVSTFSFYFYIYLKIISLFHPFAIIKEKNEIDYLRKDRLSRLDFIKIKTINSLYDGYVVINEYLLDYLNNHLRDKKPKVVVPILVEDFSADKEVPEKKNSIVYTGTYLERKDGILSILKAFSYLRKKYAYNLILTGSPENSRDFPQIKEIIQENQLGNNIQFTGYLKEEELQDLLLSAGILIIAKPENRQNIYNFPTKIGEYLVSGRPVLATKVGVIGKIMEDEKNILFARYDVEDIALKMEKLITMPEFADEIGKRGKQYALKNFNYKIHTKRMIEFFNSLKN